MRENPSKLLVEVQAKTGWTQTRLADEIDASQPTVCRILSGQPDCKGKTLQAIFDLHKKICGK